MIFLQYIHTILRIPVIGHILFWIGVFCYFSITSNMEFYSGYPEIFEHAIIMVTLQVIVAYVCLYLLFPKFLLPKKYVYFFLSLFVVLAIVLGVFILVMEYYYEPKYFEPSSSTSKTYIPKVFWDPFFNPSIFIGKSVKFLTPTALLAVAQFYKNQQRLLQLNEQKRTTELAALKQQLNPHFLFNTLNNLYALAIKKSDRTPEIIAKLSEILDYMLYGCNETYVTIQKEIELIDNYILLEKIRYGKRVKIEFTKDVHEQVKIAPLLLLTFIENAFKHGVSQELKEAYIHVHIGVEESNILFQIKNSIAIKNNESEKQRIGIHNVKKQLELLYTNEYSLVINEDTNSFSVDLNLLAR